MGRKKKTYTLEFKKKCIAELLGGKDFLQSLRRQQRCAQHALRLEAAGPGGDGEQQEVQRGREYYRGSREGA